MKRGGLGVEIEIETETGVVEIREETETGAEKGDIGRGRKVFLNLKRVLVLLFLIELIHKNVTTQIVAVGRAKRLY